MENEQKSYTLYEHQDTHQLHLFEAPQSPDCQPKYLSVCRGMERLDSFGYKFKCLNDDDARMQCAVIGRRVCGNCVSHLYTNYED